MGMVSVVGLLNIVISLVIPVILIYIVFKYFKRAEKRSNEKLELDKQNTLNLQKRIDELDKRVIAIEKILKEVE